MLSGRNAAIPLTSAARERAAPLPFTTSSTGISSVRATS